MNRSYVEGKPENVSELMSGMSIKKICENFVSYPQISTLARQNLTMLVKTIELMILQTIKSIRAKEVMTVSDVKELSNIIVDCCSDRTHLYFGLRLEDLYLICRGIRTGEKKIYDRIDMPTFSEAIREYIAEKEEISERLRYNNHSAIKNQGGKPLEIIRENAIYQKKKELNIKTDGTEGNDQGNEAEA